MVHGGSELGSAERVIGQKVQYVHVHCIYMHLYMCTYMYALGEEGTCTCMYTYICT